MIKAKKIKPHPAIAVQAKDSFLKRNLFPSIIFAISFFLYVSTINNGYNLDDELVTNNHKLTSQGIKAIPEIFVTPYYSDEMGYAYEYRPMVHVSFAIENQFFGDNPHVSHFINALLYATLCTVLLGFLTLLFAGSNYPLLPFIVTLLFSFHPIHTEVVNNIKNRDELLAALFIFLSLYMFFKLEKRSLTAAMISCYLFFVAALLCKITVLSFAVIIPFMYVLFYRKRFFVLSVYAGLLAIPVVLLYHTDVIQIKKLVLLGAPLAVFAVGVLLQAKLYLNKFLWAVNWLKNVLQQFVKVIANFILLVVTALLVFIKRSVDRTMQFFANLIRHPVFHLGIALAIAVFAGALAAGFFLYSVKLVYGSLLVAAVCILVIGYTQNKWLQWILYVPVFIGLGLLDISINQNIVLALVSLIVLARYQQQERGTRLYMLTLLLLISVMVFAYKREYVELLIPLCLLLLTPKNYVLKFLAFEEILPFWVMYAVIKLAKLYKEQNMLLDSFVPPLALLSVALAFAFFKQLRSKETYRSYMLLIPLCVYGFCLYTDQTSERYYTEILKPKPPVAIISVVAEPVLPQPEVKPTKTIKPRFEEPAPVSVSPALALPEIGPAKVDRPMSFVEVPVMPHNPLINATASDILGRYFALLFIPQPLSFYYGYKEVQAVTFSEPKAIFGLIVYSVLLLLLVYLLVKQQQILAAGIFIYLAGIAIFSNKFVSIPGMIGERYLFLPSLGFCICLGWVIVKLFGITVSSLSAVSVKAKVVLAAILIACAVVIQIRNVDWKDELTLMRHDVKNVNQSAQAHNMLAHALMKKAAMEQNAAELTKLKQEAALNFKNALRIYPRFFNAAFDLGRVYTELNMTDSAIAAYTLALGIDTNYDEVQLKLGDLLQTTGKHSEALPYYQHIVKTRPNEYVGYDKLSYAYFSLKNFDKAIETNRQAARQIKGNPYPLINIGKIYLGSNQPDSARFYFETANRLYPGNAVIEQLLKQTQPL